MPASPLLWGLKMLPGKSGINASWLTACGCYFFTEITKSLLKEYFQCDHVLLI
jgi:hypothetical protein